MRILILWCHGFDNSTNWVVAGGLAGAYGARGHDVAVAGQDIPALRRPAFERAPWGELRRLKGAGLALERLLERADLAHIQLPGYWTPLLPAVWRACRERGVPILATYQDYDNPIHAPHRQVELAAMGRLHARSAVVTALSRRFASRIGAGMPSLSGRVQVVPNGFDPVEAAAAPPKTIFGDSRPPRATPGPSGPPGRPHPRPFVLCLSRLLPYKGVDVLLLAWKDVCARLPGVDLLIAGPDRERGHYQELSRALGVGGRVRFFGEADRSQVWALMRSCLFLAHPARHESFGIAVLEAMACGKAVVATRSGGPEDLVCDGVSGLLVEPKDVGALRGALERLLVEAGLRTALGREAALRSRRYSWDAVAGEYLGLLRSGAPSATSPEDSCPRRMFSGAP